MQGMSYKQLKRVLMKLYGVTSSELDKGIGGVPYSIYCIRSYFRHKNEWLPQDWVKIGKSFSVANRSRIYSQGGADIRVLWSIDVSHSSYADILESKIHNFGWKYHVGPESAHATEMFDLDEPNALDFLKKIEDEFNLKNDSSVLRINCFEENLVKVYNVSDGSGSTNTRPTKGSSKILDETFSNLFEEE